ncbi:MAG TPA: protease pro-enzyme activation domain-containing protein [Streptosporangiaceae bacterium]|jgi:subtilase family serine protease
MRPLWWKPQPRFVSLAAAVATTAAVTAVAVGGSASAAPRPGYLRLPGSAAPFTSHTRATGAVAGTARLTIQVWLQASQLAAAQRFATAVSTPGSKLYHHYLSPDAYTARFGATSAAAQAVGSWLRGKGFTGIQADPQRNYVRATGAVSAIDGAFLVQLDNYPSSAGVNAGPYQLHANNQAVAIPWSLSRYVLGVTGLDNAAPKLPLMKLHKQQGGSAGQPTAPCSQYYGQHHIAGLPTQFGRTSFPTQLCGYQPGQMRAAYGMNTRNDGHGQTVSLVELGLTPDMFTTLQDYARAGHFQAPSAQRYAELSLGKNTCGDPFDVEEQLDVETSYDMAPGANQLVIGGDSCNNGDFGNQGLFDADIVNIDGTAGYHHPLTTISSNSWGPGDDTQPAILTNIMHAYLVRAAAQGVGMYFASGDSSGVETPDDPFSILVGGTSLGIGQHNQRLFETGWSSGFSAISNGHWVLGGEDGATSGGPSLIWAQPAFQRGVVPRALARLAPGSRLGLARSEPDIAADADLYTGFATGLLKHPKGKPPVFSEIPVGGTSMASPLVAGMVADAQQGQPVPFGFTNPVLYRLNGTKALRDILPSTASTQGRYRGVVCNVAFCRHPALITFDDQNRSMAGYTGQVTLKGYDNMTGLGVPRGQQFISALRRSDS